MIIEWHVVQDFPIKVSNQIFMKLKINNEDQLVIDAIILKSKYFYFLV